MQFLGSYLSVSSICQLLLAVVGLFFLAFWWTVRKGLKTPSSNSASSKHAFFSSAIYRQLFRLHRFALIRAISFTLALWPVFIVFEVVTSLTFNGYIRYNITGWDNLYVSFAIAVIFFLATMRHQGLSLKMDDYLLISWDPDDTLALHLSNSGMQHLSAELIMVLVESTEKHQKALSQQGVNVSLNIASWLLAPAVLRHDPAVKKFRKALDTPYLKYIFSSYRARHLRFLAILFLLIIKSPLICYRLHKLPKPSGIVNNGLFQTKYTADIEVALNTLKPGWRLEPLPLTRMTTFSVIALVVNTPKIIAAITGWTAGVRIESPFDDRF